MPKPAQNFAADGDRLTSAAMTIGSMTIGNAAPDQLLSERQWLWLSSRLPLATEKRGRPPGNNRAMVEGIFWVAWSGQPWRELPACYGKWSSVYRRFQRWSRSGVFSGLMEHVRPFECGPQAPDAETRLLYEGLAVVGPLAQRSRAAPGMQGRQHTRDLVSG
jgi:transposase